MNERLSIRVGINFNSIEKDLKKIEKRIKNTKVNINTNNGVKNLNNLSSSGKQADSTLKQLANSVGTIPLKFAEWYIIGGIVTSFIGSIKDSVSWVYELDKAITTMNITMDGTKSKFNELTGATTQYAKELGTSSNQAIEAVKLYTNMSESIDSILTKSKASIVLSNLGGDLVSINESSDALQSLQNQFQRTDDDAMKLASSISYVSANLKMDFSKGIMEISRGIQNSGSLFKELGLSAEQTVAIMGKIIEQTRRNGSSIGAGLRTIMARITRVSSMSEEEISKLEKAFDSIDVKIRKSSGEFYDMQEIITSLYGKWDGLSEVQKSWIAELSAGVKFLYCPLI